MPIVEYPPGAPFPGTIGRTADESSTGVAGDDAGAGR